MVGKKKEKKKKKISTKNVKRKANNLIVICKVKTFYGKKQIKISLSKKKKKKANYELVFKKSI